MPLAGSEEKDRRERRPISHSFLSSGIPRGRIDTIGIATISPLFFLGWLVICGRIKEERKEGLEICTSLGGSSQTPLFSVGKLSIERVLRRRRLERTQSFSLSSFLPSLAPGKCAGVIIGLGKLGKRGECTEERKGGRTQIYIPV